MYELTRLPGVLHAEPLRSVPVEFRGANHIRRGGIMGLPANGELYRAIDTKLRGFPLPPDGLVLTEKLAEVLGVKPGDSVWVNVMEGRRPTLKVPVAATVKEYAGTNAYMDIDAVRRLDARGRCDQRRHAASRCIEDERAIRCAEGDAEDRRRSRSRRARSRLEQVSNLLRDDDPA